LQPSARSVSICSSVSTPSAITSIESACAILRIARVIAAVRSLLVSVCTNERSIFTPSIGSSPRYASEE